MKLLLTGTAGFIGFHLLQKLVDAGHEVIGLDNINDYYNTDLKYARLEQTGIKNRYIPYNKLISSDTYASYRFIRVDLADKSTMAKLFKDNKFDRVIHLAAQAGVRYSIKNPFAYLDSNLTGFMNILEGCRQNPVEHLVYASSSSVYGLNENSPFSEHHSADHPVSLYGATKKCNEMMAHSYSHLYNIPTTGLRFFTVYGPWGRPDMAYFSFSNAIMKDQSIDVYNNGEMWRDFTYIDDITDGLVKVLNKPPQKNPNWDGVYPDTASSSAPYKIYNIGNNKPVKLMDFIETLEDKLGKKAVKNMKPIQPGDVLKTHADVDDLIRDFGYRPDTPIDVGLGKFVDWYLKWINK